MEGKERGPEMEPGSSPNEGVGTSPAAVSSSGWGAEVPQRGEQKQASGGPAEILWDI